MSALSVTISFKIVILTIVGHVGNLSIGISIDQSLVMYYILLLNLKSYPNNQAVDNKKAVGAHREFDYLSMSDFLQFLLNK